MSQVRPRQVSRPGGPGGGSCGDSWRSQAQASISISDVVETELEQKAALCPLQSTDGESGRRPEAGEKKFTWMAVL